MKLADNLRQYLRKRGWTAGWELERNDFLNMRGGVVKPSTVSRTLRLMAEDGDIQKKIKKGFVWYRFIKTSKYDI